MTQVWKAHKIRIAPKGVVKNGWLAAVPTPRTERGIWTLRITFHVWKYTVTIVIRTTHKNADRNEKNNRHSGK